MAHSRPASGTGPKQIEIFEQEGVDLAKVQIDDATEHTVLVENPRRWLTA